MSDDIITAGSKLKQIRQRAMNAVMEYENAKGRNPRDMSQKRKIGFDIESSSRKIEVKGQEWKWSKLKSSFLYMTENELRNATHIYIVCDVFGSPDIHVFDLSKVPFKAIKTEVRYLLLMAHVRDFEIKE